MMRYLRQLLPVLAWGLSLLACAGITEPERQAQPAGTNLPATGTPLPATATALPAQALPDLGAAPDFANEVWLNTKRPLDLAALRGKAVLVEFWTFG